MLFQRELEMLEHSLLFRSQASVRSWPAEGMNLGFQGVQLIDRSIFRDG